MSSFTPEVTSSSPKNLSPEDLLFYNLLARASDKAGFQLSFKYPECISFYKGLDPIWYIGYDFGFNNSLSNRIVSDKVLCSDLLVSRGIPTAEHYPIYEGDSTPPLPCVIKPQRGGGGKDIFICYTEQEVKDALSYLKTKSKESADLFIAYSPYIDFDIEYRVAVLDDEVLMSYGKTKADNGQNNLSTGARVVPVPDELKDEIHALALKTVKATGLRLTNIDIIYNGKEFVVLEANSTFVLKRVAFEPTLTDICIDVYVKLLHKRYSELYE